STSSISSTGHSKKAIFFSIKFQKGGIGITRSHFRSQSTFVKNGEFEAQIVDSTQILETGDCFFTPPNTLHGVVYKKAGVLVGQM
ncbi:cupin domain-containing protein, partial [Draconibacterium sp.]|nr:cupin domain-containing protein [Draconibacterium sp.]